MAGASADPSTNGVYLAQMYGVRSLGGRIRVAKLLGIVKPDSDRDTGPATRHDRAGCPGNVTVTVVNQGDGPMPAVQGELYLSTDNIIQTPAPDVKPDIPLATFEVPALAPNQVATLVVPFTIPTAQAPGKYYLGVALPIVNLGFEYSEGNNSNPFLVGDHGNAPITVE